MKGYRHHAYSAVFAALMLLGAPGAAMADCTSPAGKAGGITWNGTDSVIWCDGTNWYALKNAGASGSAGYIQFSNGSGGFSNSGTTAGQQLFWDNTNKRLGIGTVTPSANLEAHSLRTQARLKSFNEWPTGSSDVLLARSRGWTIGTPQHVLLRDTIGLFAGVSNNGGTDSLAGMSVYATQNHSDTAHGMGLSLFTTPNDGVNALTRMIISQSGNIGIGTDIDPIYTLTFAKQGTRTIGIERSSPNNSGSTLIVTAGGAVPSVADKSGGNLELSSGIATGIGSSNIYLKTATAQGSTSSTDNTPDTKMTILGNGNVGIGTTTPANKLDVNGALITRGSPGVPAISMLGDIDEAKWAMHLGSYRLSFMNDNTDTTAIPGTSSVAAYSRTFWDKIAFTPAGHLLVAGSVGIGTSSPTALLHLAANRSATSWTTTGSNLHVAGGTQTDTSGTGTIATRVVNSFSQPTLASSSAVTVTNAANVYIAGAPAAGTNTTITNSNALHVAAGSSYFGGNVGIGTATPSGTLYVKGNTLLSDDTANVAAPYPLRVYSASSSSGLVNLYYQNADTNGATLSLQKYKSGGNEIAAGDILGSIDFFGTTGAGNSLRAAQIRATAETGWGGTGDAPGRLTFWTTPDGSSTAVERMRIDNAGNVGIGTTSPSYKLHVTETRTDTSAGNVVMTRDDLNVNPGANSASTFIARMHRADIPSGNGFNITGAINSASNYTTHTGTGTVAVAYGSSSLVDNLSATGIITNATGANNAARGNSAGTISGAYGASNIAHTMNAAATMTSGYGAYNASQTTLGTMTNGFGSYDAVLHNAPTTMAVARGSTSAISVGSGATVTTAYGVYTSLSNAGTVGSWYGLYVPASTGTAPTTNRYPVYVVDTGSNYFAGNVGIGTSTPGQKLTVAGTIESTSGGFKFPDGSTQTTASSGGSTANVQEFTTPGANTWNKPSGVTVCQAFMIGGGGGGGSGAVSAAGANSGGGGGGGGGGIVEYMFPASAVGSSLTVTVGAGGAGATGVTSATSTNGSQASNGGRTYLSGTHPLVATGGGGGGGGFTSSVSGGGAGGYGTSPSSNGGQGSASAAGANAPLASGTTVFYGVHSTSGGGGAGINTSNATAAGGNACYVPDPTNELLSTWKTAGGTAPGGNGAAGAAAAAWYVGCGGGGGASATAGNGGNGGNASQYGGGGGGGGATRSTYTSGSGGNGAQGYARISCW